MALMKTVILKRTISVVAREGIDNFSTKSIAKESGCSEGLIFHHFSTKKNLLDTCYRHICEDFTNAIMTEVENDSNFRSIWFSFCRYMKRNKEEAQFCIGYLRINEGSTAGLEILKDAISRMFPGNDDEFTTYMTREAAAIGCLYGIGVIRWDKSREEDYRRFVNEMVGGPRDS